jgi:hypothetical protein
MTLVGDDWIVAMSTAERDALLEALGDALNRYEAADEHDSDTYKALRSFTEMLETET